MAATKRIALELDAYERLRAAKRGAESFSDVVRRAVPAAVDQTLQRRSKEEDKSLNTVAVETFARGLELVAQPTECTDLDSLIGSWEEDSAVNHSIADFERIDAESRQ